MDTGIYQYTATAKKEFIFGPERNKISSGCQLPIIGEITVYDGDKKSFTLHIQQNNMFYSPCWQNALDWEIKPIVAPSGDTKNPSTS
jgi:hypothetical protein